MSSPTLADFLSARLDEDERLARQALEETGTERETRYPYPDRLATCMHDARHSPARVLREVAAKRAILAEHRIDPELLPGVCYRCRYGVPAHWEPAAWPCPTLRALAAVWRDHPDYDPSWSPDETMRP